MHRIAVKACLLVCLLSRDSELQRTGREGRGGGWGSYWFWYRTWDYTYPRYRDEVLPDCLSSNMASPGVPERSNPFYDWALSRILILLIFKCAKRKEKRKSGVVNSQIDKVWSFGSWCWYRALTCALKRCIRAWFLKSTRSCIKLTKQNVTDKCKIESIRFVFVSYRTKFLGLIAWPLNFPLPRQGSRLAHCRGSRDVIGDKESATCNVEVGVATFHSFYSLFWVSGLCEGRHASWLR